MTRTTSVPPVSFARRWATAAAERSPFCLGVAPSGKWLRNWGLPDELTGARGYCERVLEAAAGTCAGFKVQPPFFERFGAPGLELLREFTEAAHAQRSLVILDAKLGDADDTMDALAAGRLGPDSYLGADAVTATAFMGFASLLPLLDHADRTGGAVFVLARTSNHASEQVQNATTPDGRTVAEHLVDKVADWNRSHRSEAACLVIGARRPESDGLAARAASALLEIPGLGRADRATAEVLAPAAHTTPDRLVLPVTTGVLKHGPDPALLRGSIQSWRDEISRLL